MLRADGQFDVMMNVGLTNEVCRSDGSVVCALGLRLYALLESRKFEYVTLPNGGIEKGQTKRVKGDSLQSADPTQSSAPL